MKNLFPVLCLNSLLIAAHSFAGSATWNLNHSSGDWNTAANWTPATVPNGPSDIATFDVSNQTDLSFSANPVEVSSIVFNPGASSFNITLDPALTAAHLILSGAGIINNSGVTQNLTAAATKNGGGGLIEFFNAASAGDDTLLTVSGGRKVGAFVGGRVYFYDTATAGSATITLEGARAGIDAYGGLLYFYDNSTAGTASFTIGGTAVSYGGLGAKVQFADNSSAADANFVLQPSIGSGTNGGELDFIGHATAANATILVQGTTSGKTSQPYLNFMANSSVGNAVITVEGAAGDQGRSGSTTFDMAVTIGDATFIANGGRNGGIGASIGFSRAGAATLIANGGNNGGAGGAIGFDKIGAGTLIANAGTNGGGGGSIAVGSAADARAKVFGNGSLTTSSLSTIGSLEGNGLVTLSGQLIVGTNNLSREFSGVIENSGMLTKSGTGTLTLSGANTYSGITTVLSGTLRVNNATGSGTGTSAVSVKAGALAGEGIISGGVTIGTGSGAGASLAPGEGTSKPTTLTLQSALTFKADGSYTYKLNTRKAQADEVIANGVTIESGAQFDLTTVGDKTLTAGQVFTAINNTAATPISGTFANLADGSIVTAGVNNLRVSYSGGDGNDLTLTVVP